MLKEYFEEYPLDNSTMLITVNYSGNCQKCRECLSAFEQNVNNLQSKTKLFKFDCQNGVEKIDTDNEDQYDELIFKRFAGGIVGNKAHLCFYYEERPHLDTLMEDYWNIQFLE